MRNFLWVGVLFTLLIPFSTYAGLDYPDHRGSSEWGFDTIATPSDVYVVNDADGSTIDRYMFRYNGEIVINIPIKRYVGPTDGSGYLQNISTLVSQGVVSDTFKIYMPAYDVDEGVFPVFDCDGDFIADQLYDEVNEVYFNGEKLGKFRGANRRWFQQTFTISTSKLKFPSSPGGVANNEIRVKIDVDNASVVLSSGQVGCTVWATEVDWVGVQFKAAAPIVLVHGMASTGASLNNLKTEFNSKNLLADNSIDFPKQVEPSPLPIGCGSEPYNESIAFNVNHLKSEIPRIVKQFGASSVNLVAHSKGGLDSLGFISSTQGDNVIKVQVGTMSGQAVMSELKVNSLVTLNTPHKGSILALYGVLARQMEWYQAANSSDPALIGGVMAKDGPWYCDLTPERASSFVANSILPNDIGTGSVATNADANTNLIIDGNEGAGFGLDSAANLSYNVVGTVTNVTLRVIPSGSAFVMDRFEFDRVTAPEFMINDIVVTQESAAHYKGYTNIDNLNHLNVHSTSTATAIVQDARDPNGNVNWRAK